MFRTRFLSHMSVSLIWCLTEFISSGTDAEDLGCWRESLDQDDILDSLEGVGWLMFVWSSEALDNPGGVQTDPGNIGHFCHTSQLEYTTQYRQPDRNFSMDTTEQALKGRVNYQCRKKKYTKYQKYDSTASNLHYIICLTSVTSNWSFSVSCRHQNEHGVWDWFCMWSKQSTVHTGAAWCYCACSCGRWSAHSDKIPFHRGCIQTDVCSNEHCLCVL